MTKVRTKMLGLALFALLCSSLGTAQSSSPENTWWVGIGSPPEKMACTLPLPKKPKIWTASLCFLPDR